MTDYLVDNSAWSRFVQQALWDHGLHRAAGPVDLLIAAYAIVNDATVIACDQDFLHIAAVSALDAEYLAPGPLGRET